MLTKKIQPEGQADESQREGPLKPQECYNHPHHPHPPRAAILPLLPDHLRAQALRLLAQLSEHGCYTGKASRRQSQYQIAEGPPASIRRRLEGVFATDKGIFLSI